MAEAIGPGTPLICINDWQGNGFDTKLSTGALYFCETINSYKSCPLCKSDIGITLRGKTVWAYSVCLFRPLNDGDTSLVENEIVLTTCLPSKYGREPEAPIVPKKEPKHV